MQAELQGMNLFPASCQAVFIGGSMARGWQHARSDADLYLISVEPWSGPTDGFNPVSLRPDSVPTNVIYLDQRRWELRYWLQSQVEQIQDKITWAGFHGGDSTGRRLSPHEIAFLSRLHSGLPVHGDDWLARHRDHLASSAFQAMLTLRALGEADSCVEDALGMLESGDVHAAVLSCQAALNASADALTIHHGEYGLEPKWRARRVRLINSELLPFDCFWELITMRTADPDHPEEWVMRVLDVCRRVALQLEV